MTIKTATRAMAVVLLAGTASFAVPVAVQSAPMPSKHAKMSSSHVKKMFLDAVAVYDAGLRQGMAKSSRSAYLRGFRDGTSSEAYNPRGSLVDSYVGAPIAADPGYSSYGRAAVYTPATAGYSSYDNRSVSYGVANGYGAGRYDSGYAPRGLMDVVVAPVATAAYLPARSAGWSYCAARYQSFDPASGTFLADDGYRYYCR